MKKRITLIVMTMVLFTMSISLAQNDAKVLAELFEFDKTDVEKIEVIYPGDGDPYGCYVDKDEFFAIAETITLIPKRRIDPVENNQAVWIVAVDKDENRMEVLLDHRARVGCPQREAASAITTQYDISKNDYLRLYAFLPEEATAHIPLENPMKNKMLLFVGGAVLVFAVGFLLKRISKG